MHIPIFQSTCLALGLSCGLCVSQTPNRVDPVGGEAAVRLELHEGRPAFKIGDPVLLDLVFTSRSPGYVVSIGDNPYRPSSDEIGVSPDGGWVRTHAAFRGQGLDGNSISNLAGNPIRVTVLLNRAITFLKPGHYEVAVTTERLRNSGDTRVTSLENCEPCLKTNAVGIDISEPDDSEETAEVVSLARELEETAKRPDTNLSPEQKQIVDHLEMELRLNTGSTEAADEKKLQALVQRLNELFVKQQAAIQMRSDARREAAVLLACLEGDDAARAKAHFIGVEQEYVDPDISIAWILVDGLASSRNKQMQFAALEDTWRDPHLLPTYGLQTALRQARELTQRDWVTDEAVLWAGTPEEHQAALEEYQREINEIIATLPLRSESNRAETIKFLKALAVPNPLNQPQRPASQQK